MADIPRLLLAAPASGSGKTTLTIGLLRALQQRNMAPIACKCGPDYIDPLFHSHVLGIPGYNLDLFFSTREQISRQLADYAASADIAILEGVMGYYDGIGMTSDASSWYLASVTKTPAVLLVNARGAALSLAALIKGFATFRPNAMIRGVIFNKCSAPLYARLKGTLEKETGVQLFGHIPDLPEAVLESRHLGLVTPEEAGALREKIALLAHTLEQTLDIDGLVALARSAPPLASAAKAPVATAQADVRIAVARDAAFCFYYEENFNQLRNAGATLCFFSPLEDTKLPEKCQGLYIGGGYPELYAERLTANRELRNAIKQAVQAGMPTVAECGGFMYLQQELADPDGKLWPMVGALPGISKNAGTLGRFGYVTVQARGETLLVAPGETIRAHEFHYWDSDSPGQSCTAHKAGAERQWACVQAGPSLFAGFPHLALWSNPESAARFVRATREWSI